MRTVAVKWGKDAASISVGEVLLCEGQGMTDELEVTVTKVTPHSIHAGGMIFDLRGDQLHVRNPMHQRRLKLLPAAKVA